MKQIFLVLLCVTAAACSPAPETPSGSQAESTSVSTEELARTEESLRDAVNAVLASRPEDARQAIAGLSIPSRSALASLGAFVAGDFDKARAEVELTLENRPDAPVVNLIAGLLSEETCADFDPNKIIEHLEAAVAAGLDLPAVRRRLSHAYAVKGMHNWALEQAQQYRSTQPGSLDAIALVGLARIARGENGDALEAADELIRYGHDVFVYGLAPAFILSGRHADLVSMYDPDLENRSPAPANVLTHLHAGINDVRIGEFSRAVEHFDRGPEFLPSPWEGPDRALFHLLRGRTLELQQRFPEAAEAFALAIENAGSQPVLEYVAAVNHINAGRISDARRAAVRLAEERRRSRPGWTEPWRLLLDGEIALAEGEAVLAYTLVREAWNLQMPLALDCITEYSDAYFLDALGRTQLQAGRPQDAVGSFERVMALGLRGLNQPGLSVFSIYRSALAMDAAGSDPEARRRYRRFVELWGETSLPQIEDARRRR